jgi:hypothetical protein
MIVDQSDFLDNNDKACFLYRAYFPQRALDHILLRVGVSLFQIRPIQALKPVG